MRKVKMVWDFHGTNAIKTAKHHTIHLEEYIAKNNKEVYKIDSEEINSNSAISFMIVKEKDVNELRNLLKPHKGYLLDT